MLTIPLAKSCIPIGGTRYAPDWESEVKLSSAAWQHSRLTAAAEALFAGRECRVSEGEGTEASCYELHWGPQEERLESGTAEMPEVLPPQGYRLSLRGRTATIASGDAAGLFYGIQTLRQLLAGLEPGACLEAANVVDWPDVPLRCMNYDLRQTFSKPELLVDYIETMASFKANALLIEYEDKFPFAEEPQRAFRHPRHALTDGQLDRLLEAAERSFIEVIPLQQTFGHLEYVLGREEYKHLRETEESTGELCPSRPEASALVCGMLEELAARHPRSRYLHLGCDEVYSLCECAVCREAFGGSRNMAFLAYVNRLVDFTCELSKKPIIWQDVLAECSDEELALLDKRVTVMSWHYNGKNVSRLVTPLLTRLQELGVEVMGAPSVRCFDAKDDQNYPLVRERLANIEQWTAIAAERRLCGLVGTNWTAVFSLGVPYGVFETSWYTMACFADASWNRKRGSGANGTSGRSEAADASSGSNPNGSSSSGQLSPPLPFIDRFLHVFHGVAPETAERLLGNRDDEDYYSSMPKLLDAVTRNAGVARLIAALLDFERAADRSRTIHKYAYRRELYPDSEPEWRSLSNNYRITREGLRRSRERIAEELRAFQPDDMAEHYVLSRFYLHDCLDERLYREMGLRE
ncbi:family 20 glycosylhydrolase [Cohnella fermenti]|nr:family 20 glycosylhydrolase [Cohnella fermenti]